MNPTVFIHEHQHSLPESVLFIVFICFLLRHTIQKMQSLKVMPIQQNSDGRLKEGYPLVKVEDVKQLVDSFSET